ncbi:hypothetical protein CQA69_08750 [Campylobacter estrildidarum]|uniref:Uncharacterized protein n=1 Tax=Campylobacter estrildidarum TaxID=2510189 RepID=A0A4U7BDN9_9BACT|nr:hypothetical protein CQA69_08750 [Campylobacter estrildidarum]
MFILVYGHFSYGKMGIKIAKSEIFRYKSEIFRYKTPLKSEIFNVKNGVKTDKNLMNIVFIN